MKPDVDLTRLTEVQRVLGTGMGELVARLTSEISEAIDRIKSAIADDDLSAAARAAHAARNSVLMLDAPALLAALAEIESGARASDRQAVIAGAAEVESRWPVVRTELERAAQAV